MAVSDARLPEVLYLQGSAVGVAATSSVSDRRQPSTTSSVAAVAEGGKETFQKREETMERGAKVDPGEIWDGLDAAARGVGNHVAALRMVNSAEMGMNRRRIKMCGCILR